MDRPELATLPILQRAPDRHTGVFVGRIEPRTVPTRAGCTAPPVENFWVVLECADYLLPVVDVRTQDGTVISTDVASLGVSAGDKVRVEGVIAPVAYSGGAALAPVYGVFVSRIGTNSQDSPVHTLVSVEAPPSIDDLYDRVRRLYVGTGLDEETAAEMVGALKSALVSIPEEQLRASLEATARQLEATAAPGSGRTPGSVGGRSLRDTSAFGEELRPALEEIVADLKSRNERPEDYFVARGESDSECIVVELWHKSLFTPELEHVRGDPSRKCRTYYFDPKSRQILRSHLWR
jgi:hypothetical protein